MNGVVTRLTEVVQSEFDGHPGAYNDNQDNTSTSEEKGLDASFVSQGSLAAVDVSDLVGEKSKRIFRLKMAVISALVIAAIAVAAAIYASTSRSEKGAFEATFLVYTNQVFDSFKFNLERKFGAIEALSVAITSLAVDVGAENSWPNYVVPDFDIRASNTRELADAAAISLSQLVADGQVRASWEDFAINNTEWIEDSMKYEQAISRRKSRRLQSNNPEIVVSKEIYYYVRGTDQFLEYLVDDSDPPYMPMWQNFPVIPEWVNLNTLRDPFYQNSFRAALESKSAVVGEAWEPLVDPAFDFLEPWAQDSRLTRGEPVSMLLYPVFDTLDEDHELVALLTLYVDWQTYFQRILPTQAEGVIVVLENSCNQVYTFRLDGLEASYMGEGDLHDVTYDFMVQTVAFEDLIDLEDNKDDKIADVPVNDQFCPYTLSLYPSADLENGFVSNEPVIYTVAAIVVFCIVGVVFFLYNFIVERRMSIVTNRALQSRAIVSSLFPAAVRDRLFRSDDSESTNSHQGLMKKRGEHTKMRIKSFLNDKGDRVVDVHKQNEMRPIADLFPNTTVLFADIAGFTSWSSERDPAHVFTLLQTLYHAFDMVAKKRGVFKVETIGDCYVACTGLPDPQDDHAIRMVKFADEIRTKMSDLLDVLKDSLGEDTLALAMRFGIHSGPVTAGVLRGEKSRFQLFGTTVSKAAQMEKTSKKNKIQVSQETADLVAEQGKSHWIYKRIDQLGARGGVQTHWVEPQSHTQELKTKNAVPSRFDFKAGPVDNSHNSQRLIDWNCDLLKKVLQQVVAARMDANVKTDKDAEYMISSDFATVREEIVQHVELPKYDKSLAKTDPATVQLGEKVEKQLREYVKMVSSMYHDNPFHSFKHASNVCTSAKKLLGCIVDEDLSQRACDPLTQFACVYSALIHDLDHQGLTNMLLIKERPHIAALYRNKSVAEQNSVDLAWNLLMDPEFEELQQTIFCNDDEFKRFRGIVVNVVMATDIFDKELIADRNARWDRAFKSTLGDDEERAQLRATLILEHVIQVADIMHCMQNFHSYQRWNERLFQEMYIAFHDGKSTKDPSKDWYQGEIWFFDNCVIPLAHRVQASGVFGAQGEDCLRNAIANKKEWAVSGGDILKDQIQTVMGKVQENVSAAINKSLRSSEEKKSEQKEQDPDDGKTDPDRHLIEWNVDLFKKMLRQILAYRMAEGVETPTDMHKLANSIKEGTAAREEVERIIAFPNFDKETSKLKVDPETVELSQAVHDQLRDYVQFIAAMYRDNEFHNFKHASSVCTAASRFLNRIVDDKVAPKVQHPLVHFSVAFAALIHDVDHPGVSNAQLVKENSRIAVVHHNKSVAEQNALDLSWSVLMDQDYKDLQAAIYGNEKEFAQFRQLVVNSVIATDLFDEDLINDRNARWQQGFNPELRDPTLSEDDYQNLRATILIEHIMQAADIAPTMQHWHSFKRWNERLFCEVYLAFDSGRTDEDPTLSWHASELRFYDNFVLPLSQKLIESGMFNNRAEDTIIRAQYNRKEWVTKGANVVKEFKKKYLEKKAEGTKKAGDSK